MKIPQGGFVLGISVDEAFRAEGYHQRDGSPVMVPFKQLLGSEE
jgi:hypothetical protein